MKDASSLVARRYEEHPYPEPLRDLGESLAQGNFQVGDPALWRPMLWPEGGPARPRILVAGCGTHQAAWFAYTNRDCEVVGVDLSEASLAHQRYLQERHALTNLRVFQGDLRDVGEIGGQFQLVVCTGVLHHMADPDEGMRALGSVMSGDGVLTCMVYAALRRTGVYMLQDLFRRLGVKADADGVAFVRRTLAGLPPWHFANFYVGGVQELQHDTAIVDTFLHPQDRAYTVPQVLALVENNGLHFQGWWENALYYPEGSPSLPPEMAARVKALPDSDQWAAMEVLSQWAYWHFFFARKARPPSMSFAGEAWRKLAPHPNPGLRQVAPRVFQRLGQPVDLGADEAAMLADADGVRTLGELADARPGVDARALFERLWKQGHVMVSLAP